MPHTLEDVHSDIKALLNSSPYPLSAIFIEKDYKETTGFNRIPFRELGYPNIHELLKTVPSIKLSYRNGETVYQCAANEKSKHVNDLVKGQKAPKKRSSKGGRCRSARLFGGGGRKSKPPPPRNSFQKTYPSQRDQNFPRKLTPLMSLKSECTYTEMKNRNIDYSYRNENYPSKTNGSVGLHDRRQTQDKKYAERSTSSNEYSKKYDERSPRNSMTSRYEDDYIGTELCYRNQDNNGRAASESKSGISKEINRENHNENSAKYHYYQSDVRTSLKDDQKEIGTTGPEGYYDNECRVTNNRTGISKGTNRTDHNETVGRYQYQSDKAVKETDNPYENASRVSKSNDYGRDNNSGHNTTNNRSSITKETSRGDQKERSGKYYYYQSDISEERKDDRNENDSRVLDRYYNNRDNNKEYNATDRRPDVRGTRGIDSTIDHKKNLSQPKNISITVGVKAETSRMVHIDQDKLQSRRKLSDASSYSSHEDSSKKLNDGKLSTGVFKRKKPGEYVKAGRFSEEFTPNNGKFWVDEPIEYSNLDRNIQFNTPRLDVPYGTDPYVACPPYTVLKSADYAASTSPLSNEIYNQRVPQQSPGLEELSMLNTGLILPISPNDGLLETWGTNIASSDNLTLKQTNEYQNKLLELTMTENLPDPMYDLISWRPSGSSVSYVCSVVVNGVKFSNVYNEKTTVEEAREVAAMEAYAILQERRKFIGLPVTKNVRDIIRRVKEILGNKPRGIWSTQVEKDYTTNYKELLPEGWISDIMNQSLITVQHIQKGKTILYPQSPLFPSIAPMYLPDIKLPTDREWNVFITRCNSTSSIWFRLIGPEYGDKYAILADHMDELYSDMEDSKKANELIVGSYYAASNGEASWRVKLLELNQSSATCFLVDHGDTDEFPLDNIYPLDERFTELPQQAVECCLTGLNECENSQNLLDILSEDIVGNALVATVDANSPKLSLTLYNTSSDEDININEKIVEITKLEAIPEMPKVGKNTECVIKSVDEFGNAIIHLSSEGLDMLDDLLSQAEEKINSVSNENTPSPDIIINQMYITRSNQTQRWIRVKVNAILSYSNLVDVSLIDYAGTSTVKKSDLYHYSLISDCIGFISPQAIKVKLNGLTGDMLMDGAKEILRKIIPDGEKAVMRMIRFDHIDELPVVEIFHRCRERNEIRSVIKDVTEELANRRLCCEDNVTKILETGVRTIGLYDYVDSVERLSFSKNDVKVVQITLSANPDNFTMIETRSRQELDDLTERMNRVYSNNTNIPRVENRDMHEGRAFAWKDQDGCWRRVTVFTNMGNVVSLELLDFGIITPANINDIFPLLSEFAKLEAQAIKGRLAGVKPMHGDWMYEDIIVFKTLTEKRDFTCIVRGVDESPNHRFCVDLTDLKTHKSLDEILISQGKAMKIP